MLDLSPITESDTEVTLPDFFPQQNLVVEREQHRFSVSQTADGPEPQYEYTLSKAPVDEIIRVTGTFEQQTIEFTKGEDYTLSQEKTEIVWSETERTPTPGTAFFVTYESDSILKRYLNSSNDELAVTQDKIAESIERKFIDTASGDDLDRIGALFGEVVGDRRGKSDEDYRNYLKSAVQSFVSRGTKSGIRLAVSAAIGLPIEQIEIQEDFEQGAYFVFFKPNTRIETSTITEVADIADPSGIRYLGAIVGVDEDTTTAIEGPRPDLSELEQYDSLDEVPDDFIDPVAPKENIFREVDIFDETVEDEVVETYTYDWAKQNITVNSVGSGNGWNEFQWGEEWGSPKDVDVEIVGINWDFADWNFIPSQGTFGAIGDNAESTGVTDNTTSTVADRTPDDVVGIDDDLRVRFLVGEEGIQSTDGTTLELSIDTDEAASTTDENQLSIEDTNATTAVVNDTTQLPQAKATADTSVSTDDASFEVTQLYWETNWSDLYWIE